MDLLIIEDDPAVRALLADLFEQEGFVVDAVGHVAAALAALSCVRYDLVVLDLLLPDGNGAAVLHRLRAMGSRAPVVVCSGLAESGLRTTMFEDGADAVLGKPFSCSELMARVRALLRRRPDGERGVGLAELR